MRGAAKSGGENNISNGVDQRQWFGGSASEIALNNNIIYGERDIKSMASKRRMTERGASASGVKCVAKRPIYGKMKISYYGEASAREADVMGGICRANKAVAGGARARQWRYQTTYEGRNVSGSETEYVSVAQARCQSDESMSSSVWAWPLNEKRGNDILVCREIEKRQ